MSPQFIAAIQRAAARYLIRVERSAGGHHRAARGARGEEDFKLPPELLSPDAWGAAVAGAIDDLRAEHRRRPPPFLP